MIAEAATCKAVLGLDVGKLSHRACLVSRAGEFLANRPVANTEEDLDDLFARVGAGTPVVVDQVRSIGAPPVARARLAGLPAACLPGLTAHEASRLFAGDAKADERDALAIARTALGIPDALLPVPEGDERLEAARSMASQRDRMTACATRDKSSLRSILPESRPAFEALADLSDGRQLAMLEKLGGPWGVADAGRASFGAATRGADRVKMGEAREAIRGSTRPFDCRVAAENPQARMLARRIREALEEARRPDAETTALPIEDGAYGHLLAVPGIGPRTASEPVVGVRTEDFPDHDHLASYCGIAPRNRQSGKPVSSVNASRRGSKRLKNLLIFSCNSPTRGRNRFGDYHRRCRDRGMSHGGP